MALARARVAAKRTKDRWKAKQWFKVLAPPAFNSAVIAETLADEPDKLANRIVETTLQELTGDMKQMHVKLLFQVREVVDLNAKTTYVGHTMTSDYTRRLTRRGNSKIPAVYDLQTNDGCRIRVKPFAVTDRRCQTTQEQAMRRAMAIVLEETAQKTNLAGLLQQMLVGDLTDRLYKACRKVHPVRRVEIGKSEILTAPTIEMDETPIIKPAAPEPETPEGGEPAEGTPAEGAEGEAEKPATEAVAGEPQ
jgi:small subunit ribosomal protein S3Ae